jgi:MbtH protein
MVNPFEDDEREYLVLINMTGEHSLWPADLDVPDGWTVVFGEAGREECREFVEKHWSALRPTELGRTAG